METILNIAEGPLPAGVSQEQHDEAVRIAPKLTDYFKSQEATIDWYVTVDPTVYDEVMRICNFNEPYYIAKTVAELEKSRSGQIMDLGCGTGLIARLLEKEGIKGNIHGVDAVQNVIDVAKRDGRYKSLLTQKLGDGVDKLPEEFRSNFDLATASGIFLAGHVPAGGIDDAHAVVKVGGHFVTAMRKIYWTDDHPSGYKAKIDELITAGKFEMV